MGSQQMDRPQPGDGTRNAFIKAVSDAARVGEITHCEARELIQEWLDTYLRPDEDRDLARVCFDRLDASMQLKNASIARDLQSIARDLERQPHRI